MEKQFTRQTAYKLKINSILAGAYIKGEGWEPNYVAAYGKKASRASVMGVVVSKPETDDKYRSIIIDDGTGRISIRSFNEKWNPDSYEIGDIINVIGRPREYGNERYIAEESTKKMKKDMVDIRNAEIKIFEAKKYWFMEQADEKAEKEAIKEEQIETHTEETETNPQSPKVEDIIKTIRSLDQGDGVAYERIMQKHENTEELLQRLLENGEIFEIQPGKVKVLE
ncbi:hypothetical protein JW968_05800 [Candidatus Woesearchaeota archaeon]|nr:hypothetical protein [Candidatus Woesearchaeota archaeon]